MDSILWASYLKQNKKLLGWDQDQVKRKRGVKKIINTEHDVSQTASWCEPIKYMTNTSTHKWQENKHNKQIIITFSLRLRTQYLVCFFKEECFIDKTCHQDFKKIITNP